MFFSYLLTLFVTWLGSSLAQEELCYGSKYKLPSTFTPPLYNQEITYTPKVGESKIVVNNGQSLDPQFYISGDGIEMADLTEQNNEAVLSTKDPAYSVKLSVKNCASLRTLYGSSLVWRVPAGTQHLEILYDGRSEPIMVTFSDSFKSLNESKRMYELKNLTQQNSGSYKFKGSKNEMLRFVQLVVEEHIKNLTYDKGNYIVIQFPAGVIPSQVRFTQKGADTYTVLESGGRVHITDHYLAIDDATFDDAGTYDCVDDKGNLILRAIITIKEEDDPPAHWFIYVAVSVFFVAFAILGGKFCWNRYQRKKRAERDPEPVLPAINYLKVIKSDTPSDPASV